ncbi:MULTISPECIES: cysteine-rich small domain-containing protein [Oscillospiraceae]
MWAVFIRLESDLKFFQRDNAHAVYGRGKCSCRSCKNLSERVRGCGTIPALLQGVWQLQYREGRTFSFSSNKAWERYPCRAMRKGWNSAACSAIVRCICWAERAEMLHHLENGVKDCSKCLIPHQRDNYGYLAGRFQEIAGEIARHEQEPRAEQA